MNAGKKSAARVAASTTNASKETVCSSCLHRLSYQSRRNAATAAAAPEQAQSQNQANVVPPVTSTGPRKAYRLMSAPVVSRAPMITRDLTDFEKAYYMYQKRLNERLAMPFTRYFYYKKGTPADIEWKRKARTRITPARDIGVYDAYGEEGWNDELLVGDRQSEPEVQVESLIRDVEGRDVISGRKVGDAEADGEAISGDMREGEGTKKDVAQAVERPAPRETEADRTGDVKSLNRKMDRSLYLLVKNASGVWRFPEDRVHGLETMSQASERILVQSFGINMNTWLVGNHPVAHYHANFPKPAVATITPNAKVTKNIRPFEREEVGEKAFFMKARIMAGQANLAGNDFGHQDFAWLLKEEVKERVMPAYWAAVRNMLGER